MMALKTCWYVDQNDKEFDDFERAFNELIAHGMVNSIELVCRTYHEAEQSFKVESPAIVIIHPANGNGARAERLCKSLKDHGISERWTYSADTPDWPNCLATRHYQKPISLQLLCRELEYCVSLSNQAKHGKKNSVEISLEDQLSIIEKSLPFPVGYWDMGGGYLIEDPYQPSYLNEHWKRVIGISIDDALANQIRTVSNQLSKKTQANNAETTVFRKQLFKNPENNQLDLYNVIFSQIQDHERRWLRIGLSPSKEARDDKRLISYLETMVQALAENYGITRLRLYSTHQVCLGKRAKKYLLIPLASFGGGHVENTQSDFIGWQRNEEEGLSNWLKEPFLYRHKDGGSVFEAKGFEILEPSALEDGYCSTVNWGRKQTRFLKLIFDKEGESTVPIALLALDKRLDHVQYAHKNGVKFQQFPYMKHMEVFADTALGAGTTHDPDINFDEISRMSATLQGFCGGISRRLHNRSERSLAALNSTISDGFAKATDRFGLEIDPAQKILQNFLENIPDRWIKSRPILPLLDSSSYSLQSLKGSPTGGDHHLENLYIAIFQHERWHYLAGHGEYVKGIQTSWDSDLLFERVLVNLDAEYKAGGVAKSVVDHSFQKTKNDNIKIFSKIRKMPESAQNSIKKIKSWIGIPIHLAGGAKAVFVIHAPQENYFNKTRIEYFETLARRTISLVNWCHFERTMKEYELSLRHEFLTPLSALPIAVKRLPQVLLMRDFINNFSILQRKTKIIGSGNLRDSFARFEHLKMVFDDVYKWPEVVPSFQYSLPQSIFDQVLYIFLSNAGRYAVYNTQVEIIISISNGSCLVKICNQTEEEISNIDTLYEPRYRHRESGVDSGGGLGLYVFKRLQELYKFKAGIEFNLSRKIFTAYVQLEELE